MCSTRTNIASEWNELCGECSAMCMSVVFFISSLCVVEIASGRRLVSCGKVIPEYQQKQQAMV